MLKKYPPQLFRLILYNPFQNENRGYTTVVDAINTILKVRDTYTRQRTKSTTRSFVNTFFKWLENEKLLNLSIECFNFQHTIMFSDYLKIDRKLCNRSHNNYIEGLRTIFNVLVEREYLMQNPFKKVKLLPEEKRNIFAFNDKEVKLLKDYCLANDTQLWLVCQFIYYCAIRPAELVKLKLKNIDLHTGKINIPSEVSKNKKQAIVRIAEPLIIELKKLKWDEMDSEYYMLSKNLLPGDQYIFPTRLAERYRKVADKLGLKRRLYDLKHTGAGMAIKNGANVKDLQLHMRHSTVGITDGYLEAMFGETSEEFIKNFPVL